MGLVGPGDIGGRDQSNSQSSMPWRLHKLMYRPITQNKAQDEHQNSKGIVDDVRRDLVGSNSGPDPMENHHRKAVDWP
jgi:hypothetical protein